MLHKRAERSAHLSVTGVTVLLLLCLCPPLARGQWAVSSPQEKNQSQPHGTGQQRGFPAAAAQTPSAPVIQQGVWRRHPQVLEVPHRPQVVLPSTLQTQPETQRSTLDLRSERGTLDLKQNGSLSPLPANVGLVTRNARFCRAGKFIAGVKVVKVEQGSPAQQAGLQADTGMGWKQIVGVFFASTPVAPLLTSVLDDIEQGSGDIVVAVDGERVENKEDLAKEMGRSRLGEVVHLSILRGAKTMVAPIRLPARTQRSAVE